MKEGTAPMLFSYAVGEPFGINFGGQETITYNYTRGGHQVTVAMPNMTSREEQELRFGVVRFALTERDGIIFLLYKFGDLPWMDTSYQWWLNPPALRALPPDRPRARTLVVLTAVESVTSVVRVIRAVTPSQELSQALHQAIRRQARSAWKGADAHDRQLAKIYGRFTILDLLAQASAISDGSDSGQEEVIGDQTAVAVAAAGHVYVLYPVATPQPVPTAFSLEQFADFHANYAIPLDAPDGDPIDIERNVRLGALKPTEVAVDGERHTVWIVQPGYYSDDFGLELPA